MSRCQTFSGLQKLRVSWTGYRNTFAEMKPELCNIFAYVGRAALERTTEGTSDGNTIPCDGASWRSQAKIRRFRADVHPVA